jgi:hypothetical protein
MLVQGGVNSQGQGQVDNIDIAVEGSNFRVIVNGTTERIALDHVSQIVIAQNGGADVQTVSQTVFNLVPVVNVLYVVSSNEDSANAGTVVGDGLVDLDAIVPGNQVALRAAIRDANLNSAPFTKWIYAPRGKYQMTIPGPGGDTQGDFDIANQIAIVGTGPGDVVIDAAPLRTTSYSDRIFDVGAGSSLSVYCVTLAGGRAPAGTNENHGGAIIVRDGGNLVLGHSAVVGNQVTTSAAVGGAIYFGSTASGTLLNNVITANASWFNLTGGVFLANAAAGSGGSVSLETTILVNNTGTGNIDVHAGTNRTFTSLGYNRLGHAATGLVDGVNGDYIKPAGTTVHYVVTGKGDTYDRTDDATVLSIRDAIDAANTTAGWQEIWLPAWDFLLTRERTTAANLPELDVSQGDLEVKESLVIRGVKGATSVVWRTGIFDKVFELLGDYNDDGVTDVSPSDVDTSDYIVWRNTEGSTTDLRADGNDNGIVDQADYQLWQGYFGWTLMLHGIA